MADEVRGVTYSGCLYRKKEYTMNTLQMFTFLASLTFFFYHINISDLQHMTFIKVSSLKFLVSFFPPKFNPE